MTLPQKIHQDFLFRRKIPIFHFVTKMDGRVNDPPLQ